MGQYLGERIHVVKPGNYLNDYTELSKAVPRPSLNTLPPELISVILVAATHLVPAEQLRSLATSVQLVCKKWHRVALHTPDFWATIYVGHAYSKAQIKGWLARTGTSSLFIEICFNSGVSTIEEAMEVFEPYVHRWKSLEVRANDDVMGAILERLPATLPSLASITLRCSRGLPSVALSSRCPSLKWFEVEGLLVDWEALEDVGALRCLSINQAHTSSARIVWHNISAAQTRCMELERLEFRVAPMRRLDGPRGELKIVSRLSDLKMHFFDTLSPEVSSYSLFLAEYDFRNLTHLYIDGPGFAPQKGVNQTDIRIPPLIHLEINYLMDVDYLASHLLRFSPGIRFLRIISAGHRMLSLSNTSPLRRSTVSPALETLQSQGLTIDALHDIVSARRGVLRNLLVHAQDIDIGSYSERRDLDSMMSNIKTWTELETFGVATPRHIARQAVSTTSRGSNPLREARWFSKAMSASRYDSD